MKANKYRYLVALIALSSDEDKRLYCKQLAVDLVKSSKMFAKVDDDTIRVKPKIEKKLEKLFDISFEVEQDERM